MIQTSYLIIGAGHAAVVAARKIRDISAEESILLVGDEEVAPYERPALSKGVLSGERDIPSLVIRSTEVLGNEGIDVLLGHRVVAINPDGKTVSTKNGRQIAYEKLLIATGSRPRELQVPGLEENQVHYLRNATDALRLRSSLETGAKLLVIGAGFIGLEVAATARESFGCDVTVFEAGPNILGRGASDELRRELARLHTQHGVKLLLNTAIASVALNNTSGVTIRTTDGELHSGATVLVCIGAVPNDELAGAAGIATSNGIVTDAYGKTNLTDVWAAGEVARHHVPFSVEPVRFESWQMAQTQAAIVGSNAAGETQEIDYVPWFWTDQYGHNFQLLGDLGAEADVHRLSGETEHKATYLYHVGGRLTGALCIDDGKHVPPLRRALAKGMSIDFERLTDGSTKLTKAFV